MTSPDYTVSRQVFRHTVFPDVVVAIPAQDEADHIVACLAAIEAQVGPDGARLRSPAGILCFVNNSSDDTFDLACAQARRQRTPLRIVDARMAKSSSHAGGARRAAMNLAADWLDEGGQELGLLFTTDADSLPAADWISAARSAFARGVDGVAGPIELHPQDEVALPAHVRARGALEARYEALLTELFARLDPRPHDPWPRHAAEAGANLAVTLRAYHAIGGLPDIACGEDRALVAELERHGFRVRHDPAVRVSTSGRLQGRAAGGVADTIRLRCEQPDALCDDYLEPASNARFRAEWRGRLRDMYERQGIEAARRAFGAPASSGFSDKGFGAFWHVLERDDRRLARTLLRPSDLPREIVAAEKMVDVLRSPTVRRTEIPQGGSRSPVAAE